MRQHMPLRQKSLNKQYQFMTCVPMYVSSVSVGDRGRYHWSSGQIQLHEYKLHGLELELHVAMPGPGIFLKTPGRQVSVLCHAAVCLAQKSLVLWCVAETDKSSHGHMCIFTVTKPVSL